MTDWKLEYQHKLTTAEEAVQTVKSGDRVYIGCCSSVATVLAETLAERKDELEDVQIGCALMINPSSLFSEEGLKTFSGVSFFMGPVERRTQKLGGMDFTSVHLSQIDIWCRKTFKPNVAFLEVSKPDDEGNMCFGASGTALHIFAAEVAETIVLQVNENVPFMYGSQNTIHVSQADMIVEATSELAVNPAPIIDDNVKKVSDFIVDQIPDGACIQLGIGSLSDAVGMGLMHKNDLGGYTELMTDSMMELMKAGVVNNKRKTYFPGKTVASFTFGSKELYEFIDRNEEMYYMPFTEVNNPVNVAKNDNMISINSALQIDLFGQVNAENMAGQQHSAVGGQVDFVRGAQMSKGGKSFIALSSTYNDKKAGMASRIVSKFPAGTAITTPRSDVQHIVTEYGCVNLKELSMKDRTKAIIELAHPNFREQLIEDAKMMGLL